MKPHFKKNPLLKIEILNSCFAPVAASGPRVLLRTACPEQFHYSYLRNAGFTLEP